MLGDSCHDNDNASSHSARLTLEFLAQKQIKVIEHPPYSPDLAMCDFWLFFNLKKNLRGRRFHSEEEIDATINALFHRFQEMTGLRQLICGKFVYKSALMLEETTLNTPKFWKYNFKNLGVCQNFQSDPRMNYLY